MTLTEHIQPLLDKRFPATLVAVILLFAFSAARASAPLRDHLLPEDLVIGGSESSPEYQKIVREVLKEAYARDVKLRAVEEPSFSAESVVALKEDSGIYRILTLEPAQQLWSYESLAMMKSGQVQKIAGSDYEHGVKPDKEITQLEFALPADIHDVKVKRCEIEIDPARAKRIAAAWEVVLLGTRYTQAGEDDVVMTDGTAVHFSMPIDFGFLAGWTANAPEGGRLEALWDMKAAMSDYCEKRSVKSLADLDAKLSVLEHRVEALSSEKALKK